MQSCLRFVILMTDTWRVKRCIMMMIIINNIPCSEVDEPSDAKSESWQQAWIWRLLRPSYRVEHLVLVDVGRVLVVIAMAEFPLVEGHHQEAVRHGAYDIIEQWVGRERVVRVT